MAEKKINMRNYKITRSEGEWYNVEVIDSYGNEYQNWFETADQANEWIYYIWENEDDFQNVDKDVLLANAIHSCRELDKKANRRAIL